MKKITNSLMLKILVCFIFATQANAIGLLLYGIIEKMRSTPPIHVLLKQDLSDTLRGVDKNGDGIRDDVFDYVMANLKNDTEEERKIASLYLRTFERIFELENMYHTQVEREIQLYNNLEFCIDNNLKFDDYYLKRKLLALYFNTPQRKNYYNNFFSSLRNRFKSPEYDRFKFTAYFKYCSGFKGVDLFPYQFELYREYFDNDLTKAKRFTQLTYTELMDARIKVEDFQYMKIFYKELDRRYRAGQFQDYKGW
ncbi:MULTISPECIES: hypothetical protein [Pseudomonadati]|uniref:hypothetical protein n=1 Tax=unclassified Halobacteriovorax TaxID=2639665 RepID=UPI000CD09BC1|nr:hypothetical protein [Halobacteriovorax sp. DA5]POB14475.1 hypothetical protein C0Z22_05115 [Halobacteriovorax sp. DA5]